MLGNNNGGGGGLWLPAHVRLFASHLVDRKGEVMDVATALAPYGLSTFVAHQDVIISSVWRQEILRALDECDCMLVFEHSTLHESEWTDQEIGVALGRKVPIVVLMYPDSTLGGFLEQYQAFPVKEQDT